MKETWPPRARRIVTGAIVLHGVGVVVAALAAPPSSPLEQMIANQYLPYYQLTDQGHTHRYYIDPPPTPIVLARLRFEDGRPERTIRIPDRSLRPRLRYQRHLALAYHMFIDVQRAREASDDGKVEGRWARSYARHLCRTNPGCSGVTLLMQLHLVPDLHELREAERPLDVDAEEFYTTPERIGDYSCDDL